MTTFGQMSLLRSALLVIQASAFPSGIAKRKSSGSALLHKIAEKHYYVVPGEQMGENFDC